MSASLSTVTQYGSPVSSEGTLSAPFDLIEAVSWPVIFPTSIQQPVFHDLGNLNASNQENISAVDGQFITIDVKAVNGVIPDQTYMDYWVSWTEEGLQ